MVLFSSAPLRRGILLSSARSSLLRTQLHRRSLITKAISNDASNFTLAVPPTLKSTTVVEQLQKLRDHKDHASTLSFNSNAAVVLATPAFARWLTDESFMSALLSTFSRQDVRVLAAVVDDLHALNPGGGPLTGFSVLQGNEGMLPPSVDAPATPRSARSREAPRTASLRFSLRASGPRGPLSLNMPLANTVFHNGKDSTLLCCTWASQPNGTYTLTRTSEKTLQEIALPGTSPSLSVPLIPVTPPRKILGCLGNIVSQIEVDGAAVPASTELENEVQGVFDRRKAAGNLSKDGMPVDIWALVSTPEGTVTEEIEGVMDSLEDAEFEGPGEERAVAERNAKTVSRLIMSGFQLHRITSGGGGWDKRRGRLSLDATWSTSESTPDKTMILNMSASGPAILQRGLVSPGSYIQFLTCPNGAPVTPRTSGSVVLGTSETRGGEGVVEGEDVACYWGHFGGASRRHFFLEEGSGREGRVRTQVDSPFAYLSV